ncbi:hypothetical protein JW887_03510 [Candidatus Dojkabacteria bacterium]|nr:hypothetical protein [Candidatus Dojkabacteria bacterium]
MDLDSLGKGIGLFGSAIAAIKQLISLMPDNSKKEEAIEYLKRAEREFKIAESESATDLGYEICRQHFPPIIMLSKDDKHWECPECHNTKSPEDYSSLLGLF